MRINFTALSEEPEEPPATDLQGGFYKAPSDRDPTVIYTVTITFDGKAMCTCIGYRHHNKCKHVKRTVEKLQKDEVK